MARQLSGSASLNAEKGRVRMKVAKTAKKSAKGWAGYKVARGAGKSAGKAVKRKARGGPSTRQRVAKIAGAVGITAAVGIVLAKLDRRKAAGKVKGAVSGVTGSTDYDDVTLARKVETELFRPADAPTGQVSGKANDGGAGLRAHLASQNRTTERGR